MSRDAAAGAASAAVSLGELARLVDGRVEGDTGRAIRGVRSLEQAGPEDLSLLTSARYRAAAEASRAGALLVDDRFAATAGELGRDLLVAPDAQLALARILERLHPVSRPEPGVHPTAIVGEGAWIDPAAHVGPYAVVGAGSTVGPRTVIAAHVVLGRGCRVGEDGWLHPHAVLYDRTELGARVVVHAGVVLGADGFGYATHGGVHHKVPQAGRVVVGDDVEIGANSAIDRATLEATTVGAGTKVDNLVQVGHNVEIGRGGILCGQAGIAGSSRLGDHVVLAGQAGVGGHLELGDRVQVAAKSAALTSVEAGRQVAGIPAFAASAWRRQVVRLQRLGELEARVKALEARLAAHEEHGHDGEREADEE